MIPIRSKILDGIVEGFAACKYNIEFYGFIHLDTADKLGIIGVDELGVFHQALWVLKDELTKSSNLDDVKIRLTKILNQDGGWENWSQVSLQKLKMMTAKMEIIE